MAHVLHSGSTAAPARSSPLAAHPAQQAYLVLHIGFTVLPILAGLDKFFHLLTDWDMYLTPLVPRMFQFSGHTLMLIVGVIEIVAGLIVAIRPRIGAYVVMLWLWGIIVN